MFTRFATLLFLAISACGQTSPFLPAPLYRTLNNEISGDIAYDHLRTLTQFHAPQGEEHGFWDAAKWIEQKARETGLQDIRVIEMPVETPVWTPLSGEAWLIEPGPDGQPIEAKLGSFRELATSVADFSRPTDVEAELIDVGRGTEPADYEGKDVRGKIVLAGGSPATVEKEAVWKRGAVGILSYASSRLVPGDFADQVPWNRINRKGENGHEPSFAWVISPRRGQELRARLAGMRTTDHFAPDHKKKAPAGSLRLRVKIEAEIKPNGKHGIVEGWIRGTGRANPAAPGDQQIILTAHIQEERFSANDDRSGCANLLELARALTRLIAEGKIPRPARDIRFWWVDEIAGPYHYIELHPEERPKMFVNINQDMVGGHQTVGGLTRVQHVTRTPWSRPTFVNDVVESVIGMLHHANNSYLAARQAGSAALGSLYPDPIFSRMGSRDRYAVEIVPYFGNSDHLVFNDAFTAARHGGVTFIQWPDEYIHSSADDIWQSDQTTLKRNAVGWAALALYLANAGADDVPMLNQLVLRGALARVQRDLGAASAAMYTGAAKAWDVENMAKIAVEREYAAIDSVRTIAPRDTPSQTAVNETLTSFWGSITSVLEGVPLHSQPRPPATPAKKPREAKTQTEAPSPTAPASPLEVEMRNTVPVRVESIAEYRKKTPDVKPVEGLHGLMRFEALNFADGKRNLWEIYCAVRAESLAAGEWYYGRVTPEMIRQYFANAASAGIVNLGSPTAPRKPAQ